MTSPAKSVHLAQELQAFAEERVRAGEYATVDEVANTALRLLQQRDERRREAREELRAAFAEMESGDFLEPTDDEFARAVSDRALKHMTE
jgi:putative addiction module CopG family antidote